MVLKRKIASISSTSNQKTFGFFQSKHSIVLILAVSLIIFSVLFLLPSEETMVGKSIDADLIAGSMEEYLRPFGYDFCTEEFYDNFTDLGWSLSGRCIDKDCDGWNVTALMFGFSDGLWDGNKRSWEGKPGINSNVLVDGVTGYIFMDQMGSKWTSRVTRENSGTKMPTRRIPIWAVLPYPTAQLDYFVTINPEKGFPITKFFEELKVTGYCTNNNADCEAVMEYITEIYFFQYVEGYLLDYLGCNYEFYESNGQSGLCIEQASIFNTETYLNGPNDMTYLGIYNPEINEKVDCLGITSGTAEVDDCGVCDGDNSAMDPCGVCNGDGSSCELSTFQIYLKSELEVGGFQFDIDGVSSITSATAGDVILSGFTLSAGDSTIIGFSLAGDVIPPGYHTLLEVELVGDVTNACLSYVLISDSSGNYLDNTVENCNTIVVDSEAEEEEEEEEEEVLTGGDTLDAGSDNPEVDVDFNTLTMNAIANLITGASAGGDASASPLDIIYTGECDDIGLVMDVRCPYTGGTKECTCTHISSSSRVVGSCDECYSSENCIVFGETTEYYDPESGLFLPGDATHTCISNYNEWECDSCFGGSAADGDGSCDSDDVCTGDDGDDLCTGDDAYGDTDGGCEFEGLVTVEDFFGNYTSLECGIRDCNDNNRYVNPDPDGDYIPSTGSGLYESENADGAHESWCNDGLDNDCDVEDTSAFGNGIDCISTSPFAHESGGDNDCSLSPYCADFDSDGLSDGHEEDVYETDPLVADTDGDGLTDYEEIITYETDPLTVDSDGDGVDDLTEIAEGDTDGDGTIDALDTDDDGDGVLTVDEFAEGDTDGDDTPDYLDTDDDDDGILTAVELAAGDTDGDDTPDYLESDDDGDGRSTIDELAAGDTDGDGTPDYLDNDDDNDNLLTQVEDLIYTDYLNNDTDGDGVLDGVEYVEGDTDSNGTIDPLDIDDDGDGVLTSDEIAVGMDYLNGDTDNDGVGDFTEGTTADTDGDGIIDALDTDDDGDGILTAFEDYDSDSNPTTDDTDGDGTPDYLDADDDGDGVPTVVEINDTDEIADDSDGNGVDNYLDNDDDGDTLLTADEDYSDGSGGDPDGDPTNDDTDGDGTPDYLDADDDGDGVPTAAELDEDMNPLLVDTDGDGVGDYSDNCPLEDSTGFDDGYGCLVDTDGDGYTDDVDACVDEDSTGFDDGYGCLADTDGDGYTDDVDACVDEDSTGFDDGYGCLADTDGDGYTDDVDACVDEDSTGFDDGYGCLADTDGDGVYDDEDDCPDVPFTTDVDGDGCEDDTGDCTTFIVDTNGDGSLTASDYSVIAWLYEAAFDGDCGGDGEDICSYPDEDYFACEDSYVTNDNPFDSLDDSYYEALTCPLDSSVADSELDCTNYDFDVNNDGSSTASDYSLLYYFYEGNIDDSCGGDTGQLVCSYPDEDYFVCDCEDLECEGSYILNDNPFDSLTDSYYEGLTCPLS